uniref:Uncharacterized protein n=1 Tax=Anguilla anguilla TaxID=7936 RepID=A0A0E9W7W5_ANGAN
MTAFASHALRMGALFCLMSTPDLDWQFILNMWPTVSL